VNANDAQVDTLHRPRYLSRKGPSFAKYLSGVPSLFYVLRVPLQEAEGSKECLSALVPYRIQKPQVQSIFKFLPILCVQLGSMLSMAW